MIAAVYARKSTDQSAVADESRSTTRQIEHARAYAKSKGWTVDARFIYCDDGISGAEFANRPAFMKLMAAATQKPKPTGRRPAPAPGPPFQILIVSDLDRLGREGIETVAAVKTLAQRGIRTFAYLTDTEIKLDSPIDALITQVQAFGAAMEREKARQRTYDALLRRAKAGWVTGGKCFGYDNVRVDGHTERRTNPSEAKIIRRIFAMCIAGHGPITIAKSLNADAAPAPRPQQDRPRGWCPSTVHEVLYRELYRGVVVWNQSRKRDVWGRVKATARAESEWLRVPMPSLRIVSEAIWQQAHARLAQSRETYLKTTNGRLWGRPIDGVARRFLLTGLSRCGKCGGSLEVRSRQHGSVRKNFYACSSYWRRGKHVCGNNALVPLLAAEASVLGVIETQLLTPAFVETVLGKVLQRVPTPDAVTDADGDRTQIEAKIAEVQQEVDRLAEGLARTGSSPSLAAAITRRESQIAALQQQLDHLQPRPQFSGATISRIEALARGKLQDFRKTMHSQIPVGRQVLQLLLHDRLVFTPEKRGKVHGWRWQGEGSLVPLLEGLLPGLQLAQASRPMASPRRIALVGAWLRRVA
jgi:site-specific DNA recombinase